MFQFSSQNLGRFLTPWFIFRPKFWYRKHPKIWDAFGFRSFDLRCKKKIAGLQRQCSRCAHLRPKIWQRLAAKFNPTCSCRGSARRAYQASACHTFTPWLLPLTPPHQRIMPTQSNAKPPRAGTANARTRCTAPATNSCVAARGFECVLPLKRTLRANMLARS